MNWQNRGLDTLPNLEPADSFLDSEDLANAYISRVKFIEKTRFTTGFEYIDKYISGVCRGEVMTIIARAGCYKTAFLQNMIKRFIKLTNSFAAFFSLELPGDKVFERFAQMQFDNNRQEIERFFKSDLKQAIKDEFIDEHRFLLTYLKRVSVAKIYALLKKCPVPIGLVGIDYLTRMDGSESKEYDRVSRMMKEIKDLAKECDVPVILLSQTSRAGGAGQTEVELDFARGSGAVEEESDFCLGFWQDGEKILGKILKNRNGPKNIYFKLLIDVTTFNIISIDEYKINEGKPMEILNISLKTEVIDKLINLGLKENSKSWDDYEKAKKEIAKKYSKEYYTDVLQIICHFLGL